MSDREQKQPSLIDIVGMFKGDRMAIASLRGLEKVLKHDIRKADEVMPLIEKYVKMQKGLTLEKRTLLKQKMAFLYVDIPRHHTEEELKRVSNVLLFLTDKDIENKQESLQRAKQVPISSFVTCNKAGMAPCVWHKEKTPSMKYYKKDNRVYCFGCNQGGDVLDVYIQIKGCSLAQAIKDLASI